MGTLSKGRCPEISSPNSRAYVFDHDLAHGVTAVSRSNLPLPFLNNDLGRGLESHANNFLSKTTTLNAQASSSSQSLSHSSHENQLVRFNQTMAENAAFLRALAEMLPTLQRIVSNNDQPSESHESNELSNVMKEVRETNLEIYRMVLKMQLSLPAQVEDQKPVYFLDACAFQARIDLTWINSWEAFLAVLGVRFKQRGLKIVERKQFVLEDANSKLLVDGNRPFESCFIPGRKINMDAFLDEKGNTGKCCPSCRYEELDAKADQAIDWYVLGRAVTIGKAWRPRLLTSAQHSMWHSLSKNRNCRRGCSRFSPRSGTTKRTPRRQF